MEWLVHCVAPVIEFPSKLTEINLSMILDITSSLEVRSINGVIGGLQSSSNWISLKTHRMTPPTILWFCPRFRLDSKSIGQRNWTLQVLWKFVSYMEWLEDYIVLVIGFHSKLTKWLIPPYYVVAQVLSSIWNQLVNEIGHLKFVQSSFRTRSGERIAQF